ncbi:MAG TPA: UDP-N-acetylglucosamine--N-acetylmuramyl-(pentapeptide) pyrophosphoryl-undecaprenol N-acetylglucosamine transferase, partial [Kineosporiaceae bacterium]|nr:UDP-N-acetylglucosamine--N-acetylmuramyl-(pentapeptide) pyrophosphoryl-undecaprenol N-acetylglucosamine transferase [Kineosporiaceae bacterium]
EARLVPQAGYPLAVVPRVPMPRRPSAELGRLPGRLRAAVNAAADAIQQSGADVVVGFGGYVATPAYLAARRLGVPIVVHEANARPGLANRLGSRLTPWVAVTFPGTPLRGAQVLGMPLRRQITLLDRPALRAQARAALGLDPWAPALLVTGGSLGAQRLNVTLGRSADRLAAAGVQVLHAAGRGKTVDLTSRPPSCPPYVVVEYLDRMDLAYAAVDAVVCRAGAGTVSEVTALGLPAAYVPLPIGNGEQRLNAQPVVDAGGGLMVDDAGCTPEWVATTLLPVLSDPARLGAMGAAAARFGIRDGDERLADVVLSAAKSASGGQA